MVSSELEGRDLKDEESHLASVADLEVEVERMKTEKEADADRSRVIIAQARSELQNARVRAETVEKSLADTQSKLTSWAFFEEQMKHFTEFDGLVHELPDKGFYYAMGKLVVAAAE